MRKVITSSFSLDPEQVKYITKIALKRKVTKSKVVRDILDDLIAKKPRNKGNAT